MKGIFFYVLAPNVCGIISIFPYLFIYQLVKFGAGGRNPFLATFNNSESPFREEGVEGLSGLSFGGESAVVVGSFEDGDIFAEFFNEVELFDSPLFTSYRFEDEFIFVG